jgi:glycosyltransferase involved in cell wall biosynthesis
MADRSLPGDRRAVVHIITRLDSGGSARNTFLTVLGHDRLRFHVGLAYGRVESVTDLDALRQAGVELFEIPTLVRDIKPAMDLQAVLALWSLLRRERPAIVHTHTSKAGAVGRIAAWLARVPVVIHTPHGHVFYGYYGRVMSGLIRLVERALATITDRIVTLTDRGAQEHVRLKIAGPEKFTAVLSGIPLETFRSVRVNPAAKRRELGLPPEGPVVGTVGRLVPIKGHTWLVRAVPFVVAEFPEARFVLVGDGPLGAGLRKLAEGLGVGRHVVFLGTRQDVPECLAALDLFVLPSLNEGMGRALVEAMAVGLPVVATRVGGVPDIVAHGTTGLLVPPQDAEALAAAVLELLRDRKRMAAFGEAAGRSIDERFDVRTMVSNLERLYETVWSEKHRAA